MYHRKLCNYITACHVTVARKSKVYCHKEFVLIAADKVYEEKNVNSQDVGFRVLV